MSNSLKKKAIIIVAIIKTKFSMALTEKKLYKIITLVVCIKLYSLILHIINDCVMILFLDKIIINPQKPPCDIKINKRSNKLGQNY